MTVTETALPGVLLCEPRVFGDSRGFFFESYSVAKYQSSGVSCAFVQDNVSYSTPGVIRGLHLQNPTGQSKLVQVLHGAVFDVAVDVRVGSPTFGKWIGEILSDENHRQLFIPEGFAHGFSVIGECALLSYKCSAPYDPTGEITIRWDDEQIGIAWGVENPTVSGKDQAGLRLADVPLDRLPKYLG